MTLLELEGSVSSASVLSKANLTDASADVVAMKERSSYGRGHIFRSNLVSVFLCCDC